MARILSDWLTSYLELTDNSEPPVMFKLWAGVSTICAALQRKCYLRWSLWDTIYPNMYVVLCGPSGCRKGTAMAPARYLLRKLGVKTTAESITREALIKDLVNSICTEASISDSQVTVSHASLTIFSEELTVFLGKNNWQLMSDLNNWFDCLDSWTYRTKHFGEDEIVGVWVNIFGATTPEFIQSALPQDAIGGGLSSRIVFVYGDRKSRICPDTFFTEREIQLQEQLFEDLGRIHLLRGEFSFDDGYHTAWEEWYTRQCKHPKFPNGPLAGYEQRRALHVRKLSMVLCASRSDDMVLTRSDFDRAVAILDETEKMMKFVFSGRGRLPTAQIIDAIVRWLMIEKSLTSQRILERFMQDLTMEELDGIFVSMEHAGIAKVFVGDGGKRVEWIEKEPNDGVEKVSEE